MPIELQSGVCRIVHMWICVPCHFQYRSMEVWMILNVPATTVVLQNTAVTSSASTQSHGDRQCPQIWLSLGERHGKAAVDSLPDTHSFIHHVIGWLAGALVLSFPLHTFCTCLLSWLLVYSVQYMLTLCIILFLRPSLSRLLPREWWEVWSCSMPWKVSLLLSLSTFSFSSCFTFLL